MSARVREKSSKKAAHGLQESTLWQSKAAARQWQIPYWWRFVEGNGEKNHGVMAKKQFHSYGMIMNYCQRGTAAHVGIAFVAL